MAAEKLFVGLDVGGTTMKAGVIDNAGRIVSQTRIPTEAAKGQEHGLRLMAKCIRQAIDAAGKSLDDIAAIGVATPGSMDIPAGIIIDPPNLKPWKNVPVRASIEKEFGKPTAFQNDANAAAYGEFWVGAGESYDSIVLFTLGTGIGGGIILNGRIIEGAHSHGGELGHTKIEFRDARLCGCGHRGCLEAYASATAVVHRTLEALATSGVNSTLMPYLEQPESLTSKIVFEASDRGDALALEVFDRTAYYLAIGAANAMHSVNPELICFAGGMTAAGLPFLERIRRYVFDFAFATPARRTIIDYARLGRNAGLIGAAGCARMLVAHKQIVN